MGKIIIGIKYKLGISKEGKDFFTCGYYSFCNSCNDSYKPCEKHDQDGKNYLKPGYEEIIKQKNSFFLLSGIKRIKRSLEDISWWKVKKWALKKL